MNTTDNIKDQAARELGFKDFNDYQNGIYTRSAEQYFEFTDRCIELALSQKPEADITIEQAKEVGAKENFYGRSWSAMLKNAASMMPEPGITVLIDNATDRAMQIYADSVRESAVAEERKRVLDKLPTDEEISDHWIKNPISHSEKHLSNLKCAVIGAKRVRNTIQSIINEQ